MIYSGQKPHFLLFLLINAYANYYFYFLVVSLHVRLLNNFYHFLSEQLLYAVDLAPPSAFLIPTIFKSYPYCDSNL